MTLSEPGTGCFDEAHHTVGFQMEEADNPLYNLYLKTRLLDDRVDDEQRQHLV